MMALDDVFIGAICKRIKASVFIEINPAVFKKKKKKIDEPDLYKDSMYEDIDACWVDVNNDHHKDLVIASSGNIIITMMYICFRVYLKQWQRKSCKVS